MTLFRPVHFCEHSIPRAHRMLSARWRLRAAAASAAASVSPPAAPARRSPPSAEPARRRLRGRAKLARSKPSPSGSGGACEPYEATTARNLRFEKSSLFKYATVDVLRLGAACQHCQLTAAV